MGTGERGGGKREQRKAGGARGHGVSVEVWAASATPHWLAAPGKTSAAAFCRGFSGAFHCETPTFSNLGAWLPGPGPLRFGAKRYAGYRPEARGDAGPPSPMIRRRSTRLRGGLLHRFAVQIDVERADDGRWIAVVSALPGAMAYGSTKAEAIKKVEALALRALADPIEPGENAPELARVFTVEA